MRTRPPDAPGGWIERLLAEGSDPDPRFTMANERTFLAWIRTALAVTAAGVGLALSGDLVAAPLRTGLAIAFATVGALIAALAFRRWLHTERALRREETLPPSALAPVLSFGLAVTSVALVVALLATR
jgi:putative membrane protein